MIKAWLIIPVLLLFVKCGFAQPCTGSISTFPYNEGFETNDGNWLPGGTASDWAWGTPTKPVITGAGAGTRCWITGGLTGSSYNAGENSWLMSPCFNFSSLSFPEISFKIFWETEQRFDGASFQYSTDGGNSWTILGNTNSNSNCAGINWYNTGTINYLGNISGWTGNIQPTTGSCVGGNGSGGWLTAKHTLKMLAGQSNVRFRFLFGAGTTCNNFDGFAIDDIVIKEADAPTLDIDWTCAANNAVSFSSPSSCIVKYQWNFDDPGSNDNTSTAANPSHVFSTPGRTYMVSLTAEFASGVSVTKTTVVNVLGTTKTVNWPGACNNTPDATLTVTASGGSNNSYTYYWDTNPPQQNASISNVGAGNYSVIISSPNACSIITEFNLAAPSNAIVTPVIKNASCNNSNGSIALSITGGNAPFSYQWSNGSTAATATNLLPGTYTVQVTDINNCSFNAGPYTIINEDVNVSVNLGADRNICPGQTITLSPGSYASYKWQDGSGAATYNVTAAGTYFVEVTDAQGCKASDTIRISSDCSKVYFPSAFSPNSDGINDLFGPLGNVLNIERYTLRIYNRYGQQIFYSNSPLQKWNGRFKGAIPLNGSYVWIASYRLNGEDYTEKGTILLIR